MIVRFCPHVCEYVKGSSEAATDTDTKTQRDRDRHRQRLRQKQKVRNIIRKTQRNKSRSDTEA